MSTFKVPVSQIRNILNHPNADKLEIAVIYDWNVVVSKGTYKPGDYVIFCPIDSIIPYWLEEKLFSESKIKLKKHRLRQIRIRGVTSQGLIIPFDAVVERIAQYAEEHGIKEFRVEPEQDLAEILGIQKYEPEIHEPSTVSKQTLPRNKPRENEFFHQYGGLDNIKWYPDLFSEGEDVVVQEKTHGTNARYGLLPTSTNTLWKKVLKFLKLLPKYEFTYGSNKVQLQSKSYTGYYDENVYAKMIPQYDIQDKLRPGETIYGEIIGPGIQAGYSYGIPEGENKFLLFDVKIFDGEKSYFLTPDEVEVYAKERGFEMTPILYKGPFNKQLILDLSRGPSVYAPSEPVREGCVVKSTKDINNSPIGKKMLKVINEDYLADEKNTDLH